MTKVYDRRGGGPVRALSEVSFSVEDRQCLVIVGPSASGKTSLLRLIAGLEAPSGGKLLIGDKVVNTVPPQGRDVAMLFQSPALYPHLSVFDNLAFGLKIRRCSRAESARRVGEVAEALGLAACLQARPAELSGGQRQRVSIGRAIVRRASLLLLDEPLANIDPPLRAQLRQDIAKIREEFGTTMIYVTHDHFEAMLVGDRIVVLREGRVQQVAQPGKIYHSPANLFVAEFFGFPPINLFHGVLVQRDRDLFFEATGPGHHAGTKFADDNNGLPGESPGGGSAAPPWLSLKIHASRWPRLVPAGNRPVVLGIRPEQISCSVAAEKVPVGSAIRAEIASIQVTGADAYLVAMREGCRFVARVPAGFSTVPQKKCGFVFDTEFACLFDPVTGSALQAV